MTRELCTDSLIAQIKHEIESHGPNKHPYPLNFGEHNGRWFVVAEVNTIDGTFDVETDGSTLPSALSKALRGIERMFNRTPAAA